MIILLKRGVSKEENLMWAKTQMAHKAGFRYVPEKGCTCGREHAIKAKPLTKEDMINGRR
jgi:hypothetical protein